MLTKMKVIIKQKNALIVIDLWTPRIHPFYFTFRLRKMRFESYCIPSLLIMVTCLELSNIIYILI